MKIERQPTKTKENPFAHIYKKRWKTALGIAVFVSGALFISFGQWLEVGASNQELLETVEISMAAVPQTNKGSKVEVPKESKEAIKPLTEKEIEAIHNGVPIEKVIEEPAKVQNRTDANNKNSTEEQVSEQGNAVQGVEKAAVEAKPEHEPEITAPTVLSISQPEGDGQHTGTVRVVIDIDANGNPVGASAVSGPEALYARSEAAAMQGSFSPKRVDGQGVPARVAWAFQYTISNQ